MGRTCTICSHPQHAEIDKAIVARTPLRTIADRYKVAKTNLLRHTEHLPKAIVKAEADRKERHAQSLAEQVCEQVRRCQWLARVARDTLRDAKGDPDAAPRAITACGVPMRELRGYLELLGKLTGELATGPSAVAIAGAQASATAGVVKDMTDQQLLEQLDAARARLLKGER